MSLNETINLVATKIHSETVDKALKSPIRKKIFVKLLKVATQGMSIFYDKYYSKLMATLWIYHWVLQ